MARDRSSASDRQGFAIKPLAVEAHFQSCGRKEKTSKRDRCLRENELFPRTVNVGRTFSVLTSTGKVDNPQARVTLPTSGISFMNSQEAHSCKELLTGRQVIKLEILLSLSSYPGGFHDSRRDISMCSRYIPIRAQGTTRDIVAQSFSLDASLTYHGSSPCPLALGSPFS